MEIVGKIGTRDVGRHDEVARPPSLERTPRPAAVDARARDVMETTSSTSTRAGDAHARVVGAKVGIVPSPAPDFEAGAAVFRPIDAAWVRDVAAAGSAGKAVFLGGNGFEDGYLLAWEEADADGCRHLLVQGRLSREAAATAERRLKTEARAASPVVSTTMLRTGAVHPAILANGRRGSYHALALTLAPGVALHYAPYEKTYTWTKPKVASLDAWSYEAPAYDPRETPLCQQGQLTLRIDDWDRDPASLQHALGRLGEAAGLTLRPASAADMELAFLRQHLWALKAPWTAPPDGSLDVQIASARTALARALGVEALRYDWQPRFRRPPSAAPQDATTELGRPTWPRLDIGALVAGDLAAHTVSHKIAIGGGQAVKILAAIIRQDATLKSIEERKRTGILPHDVYVDDEYSGGGDYVFCRLSTDQELGDVVLDPTILERADHVAHGMNLWGQVNEQTEPHRLDATTYSQSFVYEVMFKHDVALLDHLRRINVDTPAERDEILAAFRHRGITSLRGTPVTDIVRVRDRRTADTDALTHRLSKINTLAESSDVNRALRQVFDRKVTAPLAPAAAQTLQTQLDAILASLWQSYRAPAADKAVAVARAVEALHRLAGSNETTVEPLVDGREVFPAVKSMLRSAERSIKVAMSLLGEQEILDLLVAKARAGVRVQLILDPGEHAAPAKQAQLEALAASGVEVTMYPVEHLPRVPQTHAKYHPKYLVVDDERCILGGMTWNLFARDHVRDIDLRVTGAPVRELARGFERDWAFARRPSGAPPPSPEQPVAGGAALGVDFLLESPAIKQALLDDIQAARHSIHVEMFILEHPDIIAALLKARERGVEVQILINRFQGFWEVANTAAVHELREHGAEVRWFDTPGEEMMHTKLALFDGRRAQLGSANWTAGGLESNREANVATDDVRTTQQLERTFRRHWQESSIAIDVPPWLDALAHDAMNRLREHPTLLRVVANTLTPLAELLQRL